MKISEKSEVRKHYFLDEFVVIAPHRFARPRDYEVIERTKRIRKCHFCAELKSRHQRAIIDSMPDGESSSKLPWSIAVIPNQYPAFTFASPHAYGKQEIIIESPNHLQNFSDLDADHIEKILTMYQRRMDALRRLPKVRYVLVFKNDGPNAGASLSHIHSQVYGINLVSAEIVRELEGVERYFGHTGRCPYCDIARKEGSGPRLICKDEHIVCFAPYASKHKFEAWFLTRRHAGSLLNLTDAEKKSLASMMKKVIGELDARNYSYNFFMHYLKRGKAMHFYLKVLPRIGDWGGLEVASESDIVINPASPEMAALFYKGKLKM